MRAQIDQARRRRYPRASDAPAKLLALVAGKLKGVEERLKKPDYLQDRTKAETLLVDLYSCYDDLRELEEADTTQVADFVVSALWRWFDRANPGCDYVFTSGISFEVSPFESRQPPFFHDDHRK